MVFERVTSDKPKSGVPMVLCGSVGVCGVYPTSKVVQRGSMINPPVICAEDVVWDCLWGISSSITFEVVQHLL